MEKRTVASLTCGDPGFTESQSIEEARGLLDSGQELAALRTEVARLRKENYELATQIDQLRNIADLGADGVFQTGPDLKITDISAGVLDVLGFDLGEVRNGDLVRVLVGGLADARVVARIKTQIDERQTLRYPRLDWRSPAKRDTVIRLYANPRFDEQGAFIGFEGMIQKIVEIEEVRRNHRRLIGLMEGTSDFVAIINADKTVRYINPAGRDLIGLKPTTRLAKMDVRSIYPKDVRAFMYDTAIPEAERVGIWCGEIEVQRLDGAHIPASQVIIVGRDACGAVDHYGTIIRDISNVKVVEEQARQREQQFQTLVESLIQGILVVGQDRRVRFVNPAYLDMFRAESLETLRGLETAMELVAPEDRERLRSDLGRLIRGRARTQQTECNALRLDGTRFRCYSMAHLVRWAGEPALLFSVIDITPLARAQEDLRRSEERYALAVKGANDGLWDWDLLHGQIYTSPRAAQIVGYPNASGTHHPMRWWRRICSEDRVKARIALMRHLRGETENFSIEYRAVGERGERRWVLCKGVAVRSETGDLTRMAGSVVDLTAIKQAEASLRVAKEGAEIANRAKTQFLANISHELRSPLNAIIGFADIIEKEQLGPLGQTDYIEFAGNIGDSARSLLAMINDFLDMSRLETGAYNLVEEDLALDQVVSAAAAVVCSDAEPRGIEVTTEVERNLPAVYADRRALRKIIHKLLSNAIKFSSRGAQVAVRVAATPDGGAMIQVRDSGIGIAPDKLEVVMVPFRQASGALSRSHEGAGLGLSIAKALTELHSGRLVLESAQDTGTVVGVFLPPERCARRAAE